MASIETDIVRVLRLEGVADVGFISTTLATAPDHVYTVIQHLVAEGSLREAVHSVRGGRLEQDKSYELTY